MVGSWAVHHKKLVLRFGPFATDSNRQGAWRTFRRNEIEKTRSASARIFIARNLIEPFFNKIKQCRRVATRYDKHVANYLALIKLASIRIWLRANEPTP
jgi:transposase